MTFGFGIMQTDSGGWMFAFIPMFNFVMEEQHVEFHIGWLCFGAHVALGM